MNRTDPQARTRRGLPSAPVAALAEAPTFVGRDRCLDCHADEHAR